MKTANRLLITGALLLTIWSCSKDNGSEESNAEKGNDEPKAEKSYATGKVVDGQGNPIAGAKILLDNTVFYASYIHGATQEDGTYKIKVQPGSWRTFAYVERTYNGQKYRMELFPDKTDSFSEEGAVRNFVWKLEGQMPWEAEGHYGGFVMLRTDYGFYEDEKDIELIFTPVGPLIDGSAGRILTIRYGGDKWLNRSELQDIPIGRYKVAATLKKNGTNRPLKIENWDKQDGSVSELQLDFLPDPPNRGHNSASIAIGY
ncbi:carboxypeptidase-like regulatory domain-containing protein [Sphingobacterium sp. SGR-19]|uniref:carboxypeptidase-like regulatory domain-containing protein n=1 Tax=Sphingobacterium sp. SGR-19 TaxID=2710886 RepID=UPI0013EAC8D5|nr:carboxypeptidase-like regulatory domain-containing protein [Sphingobacterium sp. SGR-19]NGM64915.1 carboxypeptidase regulatory-like domain-containing protein [Sphingobacterium sp. SGR-19]